MKAVQTTTRDEITKCEKVIDMDASVLVSQKGRLASKMTF